MLGQIAVARAFLRASGLAKGDRCALVAPNSIRWAALDLAIIAEGLIAVPMYARQAAGELAAMLRDAGPGLICCGDAALRDAISAAWPDAPRFVLFDEIFSADSAVRTERASARLPSLSPQDTVAILYTSGTSGEAKGVMLTVGNLDHMLSCTKARLDELMGPRDVPDRVFHYLPFCFAASWILLLSCLSRTSVLTFSMDLTKLADEIRVRRAELFSQRAIAAGANAYRRSKTIFGSAAGRSRRFSIMRRKPRGLGSTPRRRIRGTFSGWDSPAF